MRKKLNVKLLLWTLAALLLAGAGVHFLHESQAQDNAGTLLHQADKAAARGNPSRAVISFSHSLAYKPDEVAALARSASALEKLPPAPATRLQTLKILEQALQRAPTRHELRERAAAVAVRLGRY